MPRRRDGPQNTRNTQKSRGGDNLGDLVLVHLLIAVPSILRRSAHSAGTCFPLRCQGRAGQRSPSRNFGGFAPPFLNSPAPSAGLDIGPSGVLLSLQDSMTVERAETILLDLDISIALRHRFAGDRGTILRLENYAMINIFDDGRITSRGKTSEFAGGVLQNRNALESGHVGFQHGTTGPPLVPPQALPPLRAVIDSAFVGPTSLSASHPRADKI